MVAKRYAQIYDIDHKETFYPLAKINVVRVVLTLPVDFGWKLSQLDVKNVFLQRALEENPLEIVGLSGKHNFEKKKKL